MHFDRYGLWGKRTWAFRLFKLHHTELNQLYWSYVPTRSDAQHKTRRVDPSTETDTIFTINADLKRRISPQIAGWKSDFANFDNWVRLSALISLLSYLEIYIRNVAVAAIDSDPLLVMGFSRLIDGLTVLKSGKPRNTFFDTERFVKGDWTQRMTQYRETFGPPPQVLIENHSELEQMRKLRNTFAHRFGRVEQGDHSKPIAIGHEMERLTERRLQKWLGIVEQVALAIDEHVGAQYIGEYETLAFYHQWISEPQAAQQQWGVARPQPGNRREQDLATALGTIFGRHPGLQFCRELITYYERI